MPVHWYYDRSALDRDYGQLESFLAPKEPHPDSILHRSHYEPFNEKGDILHGESRHWGKHGVHYHRNLGPGENTVNFKLARELRKLVSESGHYEPRGWVQRYTGLMLTPGWHRDTYVEEYHRGFFERFAQGKDPLKCGIKDEHIGGLAQVPALIAALDEIGTGDKRETVKTHVSLTHRHSNVLRAADCLTRLTGLVAEGQPLREALMEAAGDWFSTKKAFKWEPRPDRDVVGPLISPACYIDQAFPAALYLAWKYHDRPLEGLLANARVGGDSCHRGAVVGALLGAANDPQEVYRSLGIGEDWFI